MTIRIAIVSGLLFACFVLSGCGSSDSSSSQTTTAALSAPTGVILSVSGANQLTVAWQPVNGAASYNLYWSTTSGVTIATGTKIANVSSTYTHAGLSANTTYYYIVTAVNSSGESIVSSQVSATSLAVPSTPTGVSALGGANQTVVSWSAVNSATSYNIYWSTLNGVTKANGSKIANVSSNFVHTGLSANTTYYYIVTAVNSSGESSPSTQVSVTTATTSGTQPTAPVGVLASGGTNQVTITWNPVSGATSYNIYWANSSHVMIGMSAKLTGVTSPYHNSSLAANTTYYYAVTALNAAGESIESAIVSATTAAFDGVTLYSANCASCHGVLATSAKRGRSASQIQSAISANRGGMRILSALTTAQVQAIADVLAW